MDYERRREDRALLNQLPSSKIHLLVDGRTVPVEGVIDVSAAGVGVLIGESIGSGTHLEVIYICNTIEIHLPGITAWNKESQADRSSELKFAVGINLISPTLLHAFL